MLRAIILVCSLAHPDCDDRTAVDRLVSPPLSPMPGICFMQAQAYAGEHLQIRDGDRVRISCVRV